MKSSINKSWIAHLQDLFAVLAGVTLLAVSLQAKSQSDSIKDRTAATKRVDITGLGGDPPPKGSGPTFLADTPVYKGYIYGNGTTALVQVNFRCIGSCIKLNVRKGPSSTLISNDCEGSTQTDTLMVASREAWTMDGDGSCTATAIAYGSVPSASIMSIVSSHEQVTIGEPVIYTCDTEAPPPLPLLMLDTAYSYLKEQSWASGTGMEMSGTITYQRYHGYRYLDDGSKQDMGIYTTKLSGLCLRSSG